MPEHATREIPLRDLFLLIGSYLRHGLRYWWFLLLCGLLLGGYRGWAARREAPLYGAPLTFVVDEASATPSAGGLLGQLGFGGGSSGGTSPDKIAALAKSQRIMHGLLLDSITIDGRPDRIVNHLIVEHELEEKFELTAENNRVRADTLTAMSPAEKSLLRAIHYHLFNDEPVTITMENDEDTGIMKLTAKTRHPDLSLAISYGVYERLSDFYTEEKTGNSRATVERLRNKSDSIGRALSRAEYRLANLMDSRLGALQQRNLVAQAQAQREVSLLTLTYGEVLRNLETASFSLSTSTPFFQTVDVPFSPLFGLRPNWKKVAFFGVLLGAFLGFVLVSAGKFYRDVMATS